MKDNSSIFELYNMFWYYPETIIDEEGSYFISSTNTLNRQNIPALILYPALLTPLVITEEQSINILLAVKEKEERELTIADVNAQLKFNIGLDSEKCVNSEPLFESLKSGEITIKKVNEWNNINTEDDSKNKILKAESFRGVVHPELVKMYKESGYESLYHVKIKGGEGGVQLENKKGENGEPDIKGVAIAHTPGIERLNREIEVECLNKKDENVKTIRPVEKSDKFMRRVLKEMNGKGLGESGFYSVQIPEESERGKRYKEDWQSPLQSYHPLFVQVKPKYASTNKILTKYYDIAHIADLHVNARQELLAMSPAKVIENEVVPKELSPEVGKMVNISAKNVKSFFSKAGKDKDIDMILIGGDVIDHVPNIPVDKKLFNDIQGKDSKVSVKKIWEKVHFDFSTTPGKLFKSLCDMIFKQKFSLNDYKENEHYQNFIDLNYFYSIIIDFYKEESTKKKVSYKKPIFLVSGNHDAYPSPYGISPRIFGRKANENVPADHNLTFYEAILAFGEAYDKARIASPQLKPELFKWFYSVFTPFTDYAVELPEQIVVGLQWGNDEDILDPGRALSDDEKAQAVGHLPRSDEAISNIQLKLLKSVLNTKKKVILNSHFTFLCYEKNISDMAKEKARFYLDKKKYTVYEEGAFELNREEVYEKIVPKLACIFTGHAHRRGLYKVIKLDTEKKTGEAMLYPLSTEGYKAANFYDEKASYKSPPIIVSDSLGSFPSHNKNGEFGAWGRDRCSGTKVLFNSKGDISIIELLQVGDKPRFVVALDYWDLLVDKKEPTKKFNTSDIDYNFFLDEYKKLNVNIIRNKLKHDFSISELVNTLNTFAETIIHDDEVILKRIKENKYLSNLLESYNNKFNNTVNNIKGAGHNTYDEARKKSASELEKLNMAILRELLPNTTSTATVFPVLGDIIGVKYNNKQDYKFHINSSPYLKKHNVKIEDIALFSYDEKKGQWLVFANEKIDMEVPLKDFPDELLENYPIRCFGYNFDMKEVAVMDLKKRISENPTFVYKVTTDYPSSSNASLVKEHKKSSKKFFISIKFKNDSTDKHNLFKQYDFGTRWNFPVDIEIESDNIIIKRKQEDAEIPDFVWYKKYFKKYQ